jgi:predicted Fe-Mo cluster-binding NifX family protein
VSPRFDLCAEALILDLDGGQTLRRKELVLAHPSADELCDLILKMDVETVVCGAIEEEYYHYLRWKRIEVLDSVAGSVEDVERALKEGRLREGAVLFPEASKA